MPQNGQILKAGAAQDSSLAVANRFFLSEYSMFIKHMPGLLICSLKARNDENHNILLTQSIFVFPSKNLNEWALRKLLKTTSTQVGIEQIS